jgi:hypothetical protein
VSLRDVEGGKMKREKGNDTEIENQKIKKELK